MGCHSEGSKILDPGRIGQSCYSHRPGSRGVAKLSPGVQRWVFVNCWSVGTAFCELLISVYSFLWTELLISVYSFSLLVYNMRLPPYRDGLLKLGNSSPSATLSARTEAFCCSISSRSTWYQLYCPCPWLPLARVAGPKVHGTQHSFLQVWYLQFQQLYWVFRWKYVQTGKAVR